MRVSFALGNREVISRFRAFRSQVDYGMFYPSWRVRLPRSMVRRMW